MHAEIIALGTELTNGSKLDTNSQWLSIELAALGIEVVRHSTIGDSMRDMVEALQAASNRVQFVIITGGLGPTLDDLTRQAMAEAAGVELLTDEPSLAHLKSLFESRGREMPSRNEIQAMFPAGAKPVLNPRGTAPGIDQTVTTETNTCRLVALPGVPSEMKPMFTETVGPSLAGSGLVIRRARINCFGAGESGIEEMLGDLTARGRKPEVGITASEATITMRITASGKTVADCETQLSTTRDLILKELGELVFGFEDEELPDVVVQTLRERDKSVAVVEIQTAGRVAEWLHARDDDGDTVRGGLVIGTDIPPGQLIPASALSDVKQLADHCRSLFETDYAIAVGKLVGPKVEIAVSSHSGASVSEVTVVGNPAIRQSRLAKAAINKLRLQLLRD